MQFSYTSKTIKLQNSYFKLFHHLYCVISQIKIKYLPLLAFLSFLIKFSNSSLESAEIGACRNGHRVFLTLFIEAHQYKARIWLKKHNNLFLSKQYPWLENIFRWRARIVINTVQFTGMEKLLLLFCFQSLSANKSNHIKPSGYWEMDVYILYSAFSLFRTLDIFLFWVFSMLHNICIQILYPST